MRRLVAQLLLDSETMKCIYTDEVDFRKFGKVSIRRVSRVEPDKNGNWWADMALIGGPKLGPFKTREKALGTERRWLLKNKL